MEWCQRDGVCRSGVTSVRGACGGYSYRCALQCLCGGGHPWTSPWVAFCEFSPRDVVVCCGCVWSVVRGDSVGSWRVAVLGEEWFPLKKKNKKNSRFLTSHPTDQSGRKAELAARLLATQPSSVSDDSVMA